MTLSELRQHVLDMVHDPSGDFFPATGDTSRIDALINHAYVDIVNEIDAMGCLYNVKPSPYPTLTIPASSPREFDLYDSANVTPNPADVRKIVDCIQNLGVVGKVPISVPIVVLAQRERTRGTVLGTSLMRSPSAVTFWRESDGHWMFGFVNDTPPAQGEKFSILYLPDVVALSLTTDTPIQVPSMWHHVIAYRAAVIAKTQSGRDINAIAAVYSESLERMRRDLAQPIVPARSQSI